MEGLDDSRVQVLAMFEPLANARQLVQQVGRVVRNPRGGPSRAFVLCSENDHDSEKYWEGFRKYDDVLDKLPKGDREVVARVINALPPIDYFLGRFRARVPATFDAPLEAELLVK